MNKNRKPKGWYHRYEIVHRPVRFHPKKPPKDQWRVIHYFGRGKGAGLLRYVDIGPDVADDALIRMADADTVTVPVYVVRGEQTTGPYFGKYYGHK